MGPGIAIVFWGCVGIVFGGILLLSGFTFLISRKKDWKIIKIISGIGIVGSLLTLGLMFVGGIFFMLAVLDVEAIWFSTPDTKEMIGSYELRNSDFLLKHQLGYKNIPPSNIVINDESQMELIYIPDCVINFPGEIKKEFFSSAGSYKVEKKWGYLSGSSYQINLHFLNSNQGETHQTEYCLGATITRSKELRFTIGDPDSGEYLYYKKQ